jgi:hypothetical protein
MKDHPPEFSYAVQARNVPSFYVATRRLTAAVPGSLLLIATNVATHSAVLIARKTFQPPSGTF